MRLSLCYTSFLDANHARTKFKEALEQSCQKARYFLLKMGREEDTDV